MYPEKYTNRTDKGRALRLKLECGRNGGVKGAWSPPHGAPPPADTLLSPLPLPPTPLGLQNSWPRWQDLAFNNTCVCYSCTGFSGFSRLSSSVSLAQKTVRCPSSAFVSFAPSRGCTPRWAFSAAAARLRTRVPAQGRARDLRLSHDQSPGGCFVMWLGVPTQSSPSSLA